MTFKSLLKLCLSAGILCFASSALAQKVSAPPAIDGVTVLAPTADTTVYGNNASGGTVEGAQLAGEPVPTWFGLWTYSTRHPELTFNLAGQSAVSSATLYLYNYYYEGFTAPGTGLNVTGTATVRGIGGLTFSEPSVGYRIATSQPTLLAADTGWAAQGTFTVTGSDGSATVPGNEVGWYVVDVTSLWNANLGSTITLSVRFAAATGADGPIFEDMEGVAYAHGCYGAIPASGPRIKIIAPVAGVPKVDSFSLMYSGSAGAIPGYDPITNGAAINLFLTGTNLNIRANTTPPTDFGSVVFNLAGMTTQAFTDDVYPWALFGDASGSYNSGRFNPGTHALTATPYATDGGAGSNGLALTINFTVINTSGQPWVFPGTTWDTSKTPESMGMSRAKLDAFANNMGASSSGCVIKNGYYIYSWGSPASAHNWASASKPCFSTLLFAAINEGKVAGPDSPLLPYWPGLRPSDQTMTFRHLADMMSGYACDDRDASNNLLPPGSRWAYNDYAIQLYARTLDRVFGGNGGLPSGSLAALVAAGDQRFTVPLQFQDGVLFESSKGRVRSSPRDFARMGWLWLNRGGWNGNQLLPRHFFDDYLKADVPLGTPETVNNMADDYLGVGSYGGGINQGDGQGIYGFNWWYNQCLTAPPRVPPLLTWPAAPADTYMALGRAGKDGMVVFPSLGMIVAAYNDSVAAWGDAIITDPADPNSTMNQNLKLLTEAVPVSSPAPRLGSISIVAGRLTMSGSNGLPSANFYLLAATNAASPSSNWTRLATDHFDTTGNFSLTNGLDPNVPATFYRLQLP
jgi:hypothetical protein